MGPDYQDKKIVNRHIRSLSNDKLAGESEADINYNSIVNPMKVPNAHEPL